MFKFILTRETSVFFRARQSLHKKYKNHQYTAGGQGEGGRTTEHFYDTEANHKVQWTTPIVQNS